MCSCDQFATKKPTENAESQISRSYNAEFLFHVIIKPIQKEVIILAVHHGGKVGKAGKTLASKDSSKSAKSKAGKTLANHKASSH